MSIKMRGIIKLLKEKYTFFKNLSEQNLMESLQVFRLFELREMESLKISGGEAQDYLCLILGKVAVTDEQGKSTVISSRDATSRPILMAPFPNKMEVTAIQDSYFCHVDVDMLDFMLSMETVTNYLMDNENDLKVLIDKVKYFSAFKSIPLENVVQAIQNVRVINVKQGEEIVKIGDNVDTFYVLSSGIAEVIGPSPEDGSLAVVGKLHVGDGFGEEALVGSSKSECTIRFAEDGSLFVLDRQHFKDLLERPLAHEVEPPVAKAMIESGYELVDVRSEEEYEMSYIPGSNLIPLYELRQRLDEFEKNRQYVVYCRSGRRSLVAAFMLMQHELNALSLKGGIVGWPYDVIEN